MPTLYVSALVFAESFLLYSALRYSDQQSTKKLAERLDIQKHEVNPLLTLFARRWGLSKAFRTTWLITAPLIALSDVLLGFAVSWGFPVVAFLFGTVHILASASNTELEYRTRNMTKEEIEDETYNFARQLSKLTWPRQILLLTERHAFSFVAAAISLLVVLLFVLSDKVTALTQIPIYGAVMVNMAIITTTALLIFFPAVFLGTIIWSRRLVRMYETGQLERPPLSARYYVEIPVLVAEEALSAARSSKASTIKLQVDTDFKD